MDAVEEVRSAPEYSTCGEVCLTFGQHKVFMGKTIVLFVVVFL